MLRRLLFLLSVVIFSDTNSVFGQEISCEGNNIEFNKTEEIILQDDLFPFDNSGAVLVSDSLMFLAFYNPASVIIFDREGKQIGIVGGKGRGPQELLMPSILNKKENDFVVWDAAQMKFVVFDADGEAYAELSGVKQSIGSFFFQDEKLFTYNTGYLNGPLISIFDLNRNKLVPSGEIDEMNEQHKKLLSYGGTRPFAIKGTTLYYARADKDEFFVYNISASKRKRIRLRDKEFSVEKSTFSMNAYGQKANDDWQEFIFTSSRFKNMYSLDDYLIAEVQHGSIYDGSRKTKYFVYDDKLRLLDTCTLSNERMLEFGDGAITAHKNSLIFYANNPDSRTPDGRFSRGYSHENPYEHFFKKLTFFEVMEIDG